MEKKKLDAILDAMQGITYSEWKKLRICIDKYFQYEAGKQNNEIPLTNTEMITEEYKHYSSTI